MSKGATSIAENLPSSFANVHCLVQATLGKLVCDFSAALRDSDSLIFEYLAEIRSLVLESGLIGRVMDILNKSIGRGFSFQNAAITALVEMSNCGVFN